MYSVEQRHIASSCAEVYKDARVYDTGMVTIIEIMGRHAGWLAASAALAGVVGHPVRLTGAGRTDAGVHALGQAASVQLPHGLTPGQVMDHLNRYLPEDIAVTAVEEAPPRFHARLSAAGKVYRYQLRLGPVPDVFRRKYQYRVEEPLDLTAMERAAALLTGTHDFRSFCANRRFKKSTVRTVRSIEFDRRGADLSLTFRGDGFLYHMVRIMAGTLLEIGQGKFPPGEITAILRSEDRERAGKTAPACGLYLERVFYEQKEAEL